MTPTPREAAQRRTAVLHRKLHDKVKTAVGAEGNYIILEDGQRVFDSTGGAAVACLGHGNAQVKAAIVAQMDEISYCHTLFFATNVFEDLARFLADSTGGRLSKVFIVNSGSEAMEAAIKLARQYYLELPTPEPQRTKFIARQQSYHGVTMGSLSMGGHVFRRELFEPLLLSNVSHVSPCNTYRGKHDGESDAEYVKRLADELDAEFQRVGPENVCAFVAEPVVGAALGCVPSVPGYFPAMKAVCEKYGALLILDEVMSGMGRSGTLHAWEQEGVVPDIQAVGKGLGGGYAPVSGLLISERIVDAIDKGTGSFRHGQTYQGHPIACAAALAVQKIIKQQNLLENVRKMGSLLESLLREGLGDHPNVGDIRGKGLFWGIEFVRNKSTKQPFDPLVGVAMKIQDAALSPKYSLSLYAGGGTADGVRGDHVLLAPAYNVTEEDVRIIAERTIRVVTDILSELNDKDN
ncbi:hypothetical protein AJ79_06623 [Helicocarpus griseus UAMH5409]|uniref:Aminotransferase n=1 Tax=Helicocarpus griseus UAMH5409 TaxID=1447875 RepID=A0A2B7XB20_9EURO|nr:hypothetical protein AJ79_06623 [Helicocarpus griseus UAMH5409]